MEKDAVETKKLYLKNHAYDVEIVRVQGAVYHVRLIRCSDGFVQNILAKVLFKDKQHEGTTVVFMMAGVLYSAVMDHSSLVSVSFLQKTYMGSVSGFNNTITPARVVRDGIASPAVFSSDVLNTREQTELEVLVSPLAGRVITILVDVGQRVSKFEPLVVIESMKMENELCAPCDAIIKTLFIQPGDLVQPKQELIGFDQEEGVSNAATQGKYE